MGLSLTAAARAAATLLLAVLCVLLAWQSLQLWFGPVGAAPRVFGLAQTPQRLLSAAAQSATPETGAVAALAANPTDPKSLLLLLDKRLIDDTPHPVRLATELAPADAAIRYLAGNYWAARGRLATALDHWRIALTQDPDLKSELYPVLLRLAEDPDRAESFAGLAAAPPPWWPDFFYTAAKQDDLTALRLLYRQRLNAADAAPSAAERGVLIDKLYAAGFRQEAYLRWLSGLDDEQRSELALIYDGGFERGFGNRPFHWQRRRRNGASIDLGRVPGMSGEQALRVKFNGKSLLFADIWQYLHLSAGSYRLTGRARMDRLRGETGVRWAVRCEAPEKALLATTEALLGSSDWQVFQTEFTVPPACDGQRLRLEAIGARWSKALLSGSVWFDDLKLQRLKPG